MSEFQARRGKRLKVEQYDALLVSLGQVVRSLPSDIFANTITLALLKYREMVHDVWIACITIDLDIVNSATDFKRMVKLSSTVCFQEPEVFLEFTIVPKQDGVSAIHEKIVISNIRNTLLTELLDSMTQFTILHLVLAKTLLDCGCEVVRYTKVKTGEVVNKLTIEFSHTTYAHNLELVFNYDVIRRDDVAIASTDDVDEPTPVNS